MHDTRLGRLLNIVILTLLLAAGLMASDIYLPALPNITSEFASTPALVQKTISIFLLGLAISQLFYGPLSDRYGRKKTVLVGLLVYCLASFACSAAGSLDQLILYRFLQAIGAGAGMVIGRAIVSDLFEKEQAAKVMATIFPIVGMSPAIAPVIGGYLSQLFGWRAAFSFTFGFGIVSLLMVLFFLRETRKPQLVALGMLGNFRNYTLLVRNPLFWGYALTVCCAYAAYFSYIVESPYIFKSLGFVSQQIGYFYITLSITYVSGNVIARRLVSGIEVDRLLFAGYGFFLAGGAALVFFSLHRVDNPLQIIVPMSVLTFGNGFLLPLGVARSVASFPTMAGAASGLMGFLQLGAASLAAALVGMISHGNPLGMSLFILGITAIGFLFFLALVYLKKESPVWEEKAEIGACDEA